MAGKRSQLCHYVCSECQKPQDGAPTALLSLLNLCEGCQEKRYAKGLADQAKALAGAAA